ALDLGPCTGGISGATGRAAPPVDSRSLPPVLLGKTGPWMCFSASASFAAAGITAAAGALAIASAKGSRYRLLAVAPIFFSLQQLAEGVLWRTFDGAAGVGWQAPAAYFFLIVANGVWPIWVPLAFRSCEADRRRRGMLTVLLALGVIESIGQLWALAAHAPVASLVGRHIAYHIEPPWAGWRAVALLYPVVVVAPQLLSGNWMLRLIGVAVLLSLVVARIAYLEAAPSVWCFFAAIISGLVAVTVRVEAARRPAPGHSLSPTPAG
ncbi:MAG: DUF6629 family protein, partial [Gemmatimonadales bacterium]